MLHYTWLQSQFLAASSPNCSFVDKQAPCTMHLCMDQTSTFHVCLTKRELIGAKSQIKWAASTELPTVWCPLAPVLFYSSTILSDNYLCPKEEEGSCWVPIIRLLILPVKPVPKPVCQQVWSKENFLCTAVISKLGVIRFQSHSSGPNWRFSSTLSFKKVPLKVFHSLSNRKQCPKTKRISTIADREQSQPTNDCPSYIQMKFT